MKQREALSGEASDLSDFEIGRPQDVHVLITEELQPFIASRLGDDMLEADNPLDLSYKRKLGDLTIRACFHAEQTGVRSPAGLRFSLTMTKYKLINEEFLSFNTWKNMLRIVAEKNAWDGPIDEDAPWSPEDFASVSTFTSNRYTFQKGKRPQKVVSFGCQLVDKDSNGKKGNIYSAVMNSTSHRIRIGISTKEKQQLDVLENNYSGVLTSGDIDEVYNIMHLFGHKPSDKARSRQALARYVLNSHDVEGSLF